MTFDHFTIRPIHKNDAESFFALVSANRSRIKNYLPITEKAIQDKRSTVDYIKEKIKTAENKTHYCFVVTDTVTYTLAGAFFLKNFDWSVPKCELGYFIDGSYEGKGITSKGISKLIDHCFEKMGMNKLFLRSATDNFSSRKVAEKNGFIVEGILRNDFKNEHGELIDVVYYGLVKPKI